MKKKKKKKRQKEGREGDIYTSSWTHGPPEARS
jgi:hypothetical protein